MAKRLFDVIASAFAMVVLSPVFVLAYFSVRLTSSGPAIYRAQRIGRGGDVFTMHKFRTMHVGCGSGSLITGANDSRVFLAGRLLRALKIDELPQLHDVLIGKMSIVGPRPEDPGIVEQYYSPLGRRTLEVAPGLASPGSIYNYTHGHLYLDDNDPERSYVGKLLPIKLALELVYVRRASLWYDVTIIVKTVVTILQIAFGKRRFAEPPEFAEARKFMENPGTPLVTQAAENRTTENRKQYVGKVPTSRGHRSSGCESGHWVDSVSNDGQIVKLEDGSIWEVDAVDTIDSALWLPTTDIVACDDKLINTEDNETVSATRIR